jgi:hypothetical protein
VHRVWQAQDLAHRSPPYRYRGWRMAVSLAKLVTGSKCIAVCLAYRKSRARPWRKWKVTRRRLPSQPQNTCWITTSQYDTSLRCFHAQQTLLLLIITTVAFSKSRVTSHGSCFVISAFRGGSPCPEDHSLCLLAPAHHIDLDSPTGRAHTTYGTLSSLPAWS